MAPRKYRVIRPSEFRRELSVNDVLYEYLGHDFGCVRSDWEFGDMVTIALTQDPEGAGTFFTVPKKDLEEIREGAM